MNTKTCPKCNNPKSLEEFNWKVKSKNIRQSYCSNCSSTRSHKYYEDNKEKHLKVIKAAKLRTRNDNRVRLYGYLLSHPCIDCGESNPVVLDFDHADPSTKSGHINIMVSNGCSWKKIETEISKCNVRCANDHRIRTARQSGSYKLALWENNLLKRE